MTTPVILLTGAAGQLGHELRRTLAPLGRVVPLTRRECDLTDERALRAVVRAHRPDLVVNAAAYNAVDRAESEPDLAMAVNARVPAVLAEAVQEWDGTVIHYSTDFVFDGTKGAPYVEHDAPSPLGAYGRSKRAGETALLATGAPHVVLRTSWVVGPHGDNFVRAVLRLAAERDELRMVADQTSIPTSAPALADATARIGAQRLSADGRRGDQERTDTSVRAGLFHLAATGASSRYDYARFIVAEASAMGHEMRLTLDRIHPITAAEFGAPARRPADSRLDSTRAAEAFGVVLPEWRLGVRAVLRQILRS